MLINVTPLEEIVELVLYSRHLKNTAPLSCVLTAPMGSGKTELLKQYSKNGGIRVITDCTAHGILRDFGDEIRKGNIKHACRNLNKVSFLVLTLSAISTTSDSTFSAECNKSLNSTSLFGFICCMARSSFFKSYPCRNIFPTVVQ